ncbi:MAG TPA: hypothetical protein VFL66_03270 [Gaiellaceae bacterium]|nr:hypothetical protein [Gaiellaceae bacterium]
MAVLAAATALVAVHLFAAAVWIGGFVAIGVVGRVARRTLEPPARIVFFRGLGRAYGVVGGASLLVALATGAALLPGSLGATETVVALALGAALLGVTAAGVRQARALTRLRTRALAEPALAETLRRAGARAFVLRAAIGLLTLALLGVGVVIAT